MAPDSGRRGAHKRTPRAEGAGGADGSTGGGGGGEPPRHLRFPPMLGRGFGGGRLSSVGGRTNSFLAGRCGGGGHEGGRDDADGGAGGGVFPRGRGGDGALAAARCAEEPGFLRNGHGLRFMRLILGSEPTNKTHVWLRRGSVRTISWEMDDSQPHTR